MGPLDGYFLMHGKCGIYGVQMRAARSKTYKPKLGTAFDHILIHTGAAAVISAVVRGLGLEPKAAVPSSETLERFGNTMLCSTYYILANIESQVSCR
jgi:3-ketoacyl-CoA synthase